VRQAERCPLDLREARDRLRKYEREIECGGRLSVLIACDLAVLQALVASTESLALQLTINPLVGAFEAYPAVQEAIFRDPRRNAAGYAAVLDVLHAPAREMLPNLLLVLEAAEIVTLRDVAEYLGVEGPP
jgi:hypothetical protein